MLEVAEGRGCWMQRPRLACAAVVHSTQVLMVSVRSVPGRCACVPGMSPSASAAPQAARRMGRTRRSSPAGRDVDWAPPAAGRVRIQRPALQNPTAVRVGRMPSAWGRKGREGCVRRGECWSWRGW